MMSHPDPLSEIKELYLSATHSGTYKQPSGVTPTWELPQQRRAASPNVPYLGQPALFNTPQTWTVKGLFLSFQFKTS